MPVLDEAVCPHVMSLTRSQAAHLTLLLESQQESTHLGAANPGSSQLTTLSTSWLRTHARKYDIDPTSPPTSRDPATHNLSISIPATPTNSIRGVVVLGVAAKLVVAVNLFFDLCKLLDDEYVKSVIKHPKVFKILCFVAAFGTLDIFIGLIAAIIAVIPRAPVLGFDTLAAIFFLVGGIISASKRTGDQRKKCHWDSESGFCGRFDTMTAFMLLGLPTTLGVMATVFFSRRSDNKNSAI
ncbi:hypothetical protein DOTSEDRAFT_39588 [Dothistroma septosporum NZE10]|uniref:MARVEL domain-containing protein n=1 Tax=Dothistroma septosporum (strain NZE10 / CBS 128990) TaxID=675120 RepID=M2XG45_DOTSN|nr:hypothetical protein DOTSEDRAFT_39588 [Dothistroma septosporum NZE10]